MPFNDCKEALAGAAWDNPSAFSAALRQDPPFVPCQRQRKATPYVAIQSLRFIPTVSNGGCKQALLCLSQRVKIIVWSVSSLRCSFVIVEVVVLVIIVVKRQYVFSIE